MENQAYLKRKKEYNIIIKNQYLILYRFINEKACLSDGFLVNVNIFDTAGQERFKESITSQYYKKADCCLLVYDISNRKSFEELKYYSKKIEECCKKNIQVI